MAQVEPMDIDNVGSDFDDKENSLQNSNFLSRTPCTEKGYEELDVSELNMKLRYSITPASSPMSKSYTASCKDNKTYNFDEDSLNSTILNNSANLTRSLNSSITKCDIVPKLTSKLPLQALTTDNNSSVRRSLDNDPSDITITVNGIGNIDENVSLPSGSSSAIQTPEATTPTKDIPKGDGGSPIMRGLKSVLSMFRSSQSPIPPEDNTDKKENESHSVEEEQIKPLEVLASTPKANNKNNDNNTSKRNSPLKDSVVFNDDLERELQWKNETTIIFKQERMPIHKLFLPQSTSLALDKKISSKTNDMPPLNSTVEYMDISYNEPCIGDKTTDVEDKICVNNVDVASGVESDGEFLDCETTYTKNEQIDLKQHTSITNLANTENNVSTQEICNENIINPIEKIHVDMPREVEIVQATNATNVDASDVNYKEQKCEAELINEFHEQKSNIPLNAQKEIECHTQDGNILIKDMNLTSAETKIESSINMQQPDILMENFIKNEENKTIDFDNQNNSILSSSTNKENTKQKDENQLNFDATMPLNIVTDCQDNILLNQNNDCNNFILINKENLEHENKTLPLNSGILQICENLSDQTVHEHANNTLDLKSDMFNLEDHTEEKNVENDHIVNSEEYLHDNLTHYVDNNCEKNEIFDSIDQNTQELETALKQEEISMYDSIKNQFQNNDNVNDLGNIKSQDIEKDINLYDLSLNDVNDHLPSDIPLPSDDDIEKDSLMDNFVIKNDDIEDDNNFDCVKSNTKDNLECMDSTNEGAVITNVEITSKDLTNISSRCTALPNSDEIKDISLATENILNSSNCDLLINKTEIIQESTSVELPVSETNLSDTLLETNENHQCLNSIDIAINQTIDNTVSVNDGCMDRQSINHTYKEVEEKELENKECVLNEENKVNILDDNVRLKENKLFDEEIVTSANNSPYVSVNDLDLNIPTYDIKLDDIESPFETKNKIDTSPPISPKLSQKGYNINFDEIEDPFATKTNIRMSPPPDFSPNNSNASVNITQKKVDIKKRAQPQNRRRSQPEREKREVTKKRFNSSYNCDTRTSNCKKQVVAPLNQDCNVDVLGKNQTDDLNCTKTMLDVDNKNSLVTNASTVDNLNISNTNLIHPDRPLDIEENNSLHIEPTRLSFPSKNVFNLPEIDDKNFNPFATKSKICMSPSPTFEEENTLMEENVTPSDPVIEMSQQRENITSDLEKHNQEEKVVSSDVSSETCSSRNTDKDFTVREVHTEDEDTVEGHFLEVEEFADVVKVSDFGDEADMMQFEDLHADINNENKEDGELFIDAEAFEFLLNQNKCNIVADSGKESLFLKFDPLFAKRVSSDGVLAALNRIQKRQSTPKKIPEASKQNNVIDEEKPSVSASNVGPMFEENNDETVMVTKPMMVVNPAINSLVSPRKSVTPPRINRRSLTFTSPAMAVIDRLLSLSGNSSNLDHDTTPPRGIREYNETDVALTQLRELLAEKEIHVHNLRSESKELKERLATMESQVKTLEKETEERLKKVNDLNERLAEKTKVNKSMAVVVEEYERTIASLIAEMELEKRRNAEERKRLISERDEQTAHLASMEVSFSDLHSKYEKSKQIILSMKANEDTYRKSIKDFEDNLLKMQNNYELLKQHATSKLNHANQELEKFNRSHESEVLKLNAMIKRKELHITSLEESLTQKTKANEELTAICDELINKVG